MRIVSNKWYCLVAIVSRQFIKVNNRLFAVITLIAFATSALAQTSPIAELSKIKQAYNSSAGMSFKGIITMYHKNNAAKTLDKLSCEYVLKGANYYCKLGPVEMLLNNNYFISVDNDDRYLMVGSPANLPKQQDAFIANLSNLKKMADNKELIISGKKEGNQQVLNLEATNANAEFKKYTIYYQPDTYLISKVKMETAQLNENGSTSDIMLETIYNYNTGNSNESIQALLSETRFVTVAGKNIQANKTYKNYQLINQL